MKLFITIVLLFFVLSVSAQHIANTFQAVEKGDFSMQKLDASYSSAIAADSTKAVFKGSQQDKFIKAYGTLLNTLAVFLNNNNFRWETPTRIFNRIYFAPDGSINYYLVNLVGTNLTDEKQRQFLKLLNTFIKTNKINITANSRFAQCSPVIYKDVK